MSSCVHRQSFCVTSLLLGLAFFATTIELRAQTKINLTTVYLQQKVGSAHVVQIHGELDGKGMLLLDPNTCALNQFGDQTICTKIAPRGVEVKIVRLRLADSSGQGRRIYQLVPEQDLEDKYFLVVPRKRSGAHRLVVNEANDHRRVITLEQPVAQPPVEEKPKPELCKHGKYRAVQKDGQVTLYATGEHPTAGYKTALEQLPIRIFPPQYRLVCVKPTGIVAQVITPFSVMTTFASNQPVPAVVVHDANGQHKVPVAQQ